MNAQLVLDKIRDLNVLVMGDVCLDRWCYYDPALSEPSRETGIPRLAVVKTEVTPGAVGTIANNLVALGVRKVSVLGAVGEDGFGWELLGALASREIASDLLVRSSAIRTFTYTKLMNVCNGVEDQPRVDFITPHSLPEPVEDDIVTRLQDSFDRFDVVIVCDQAETEFGGVVTERVREALITLANSSPEKTVWVDSRVRIEKFRDVVAKPNAIEAEQACLRAFDRVDLPRLRKTCGFKLLMVTQGDEGVRIFSPNGEYTAPGRKVRAVDICGAGDSFSAGAACALAVTGDPVEAARFGNLVASITVQKHGTGTASPEELLEAGREPL